ncbi:MAG TPA: DNA-directed RNA polymerase subunit alpha [Patescibacteria group bacterium]|jgi:DNA-directed RNA polymerase subunit alpha|nr:DNA-directed RNA polymerase subunit alpha [Patescibacteria group bacterium]
MEQIPLPNQAHIENVGGNTYEVTLEPLYPGFGVTIGNAMRRVLLSSMPGAAVTAVKIKYVDHEFSTVPNVKEDVIQLILNLKQLRLRSFSREPVRLTLQAKGEGVVTAEMIEGNDQVEVVNKDLYICTLDNKNADFDMEIIVEQGRGYVPVESREGKEKLEVGMLSIDAIYTPVRSVFFDVSNVRVGQITNFDKLVLRMETDGTITGQEAIDIASHILVDHFSMMFNNEGAARIEMMATPLVEESAPEEGSAELIEPTFDETPASTGTSLDELNLSNRAKNALTKAGIGSVEALQGLTNDEITNTAGLGEKTIAEILEVLGRNQTN